MSLVERDLSGLGQKEYDLAVIGGGIHGACVAWEAACRGLSVALLEKSDFASATSANSLKIIHGGFRYLQNADLGRMRASIHERALLMQLAPHLVHPLPVLVPAYGHGLKGREAFSLAILANELIAFDRNRLEDPQKSIPPGRIISRRECLERMPGLPAQGLTGGAIFYDAQVYHSERLVLAFLRSAAEAGAELANYVEVTGFLREGGRVCGLLAQDAFSGEILAVRARAVVNAGGPWIDALLAGLQGGEQVAPRPPLAKAVNLITRPLFEGFAAGIPAHNDYLDGRLLPGAGSSYLFVAPWRGRSIVGTVYTPFRQRPEALRVEEGDVGVLLGELNRAYPAAKLAREEVSFVHAGLLPAEGIDPRTGAVRLRKHARIADHRPEGAAGLISVEGVKYTTARRVAEEAVKRAFSALGYRPPRPDYAEMRLHGGRIERFEEFLQAQVGKRPCGLDAEEVRSLVYQYGSAYPEVLDSLDVEARDGGQVSKRLAVLKAQVRYAIRREMAVRLADVVFRRTELGTAGHPGEDALRFCAGVMADELGWGPAQIEKELEEVERAFRIEGSS